MSTNKFIDGTPIPEGYQQAVTKLMNDACDAEEAFDIDELERHAEKLKREQAIRAATKVVAKEPECYACAVGDLHTMHHPETEDEHKRKA